MGVSWADALSSWSSNVLHGFVPLVQGAIGCTVSFSIAVAVFLKDGVVGLIGGTSYHGTNIEVSFGPGLGADG